MSGPAGRASSADRRRELIQNGHTSLWRNGLRTVAGWRAGRCPADHGLDFELAAVREMALFRLEELRKSTFAGAGARTSHCASINGETVHSAPPEYAILRKFQFFREGGSPKQLRDISHMRHSLGPEWDRSEWMPLIKRYGLHQERARAAASRTQENRSRRR